MKALTDFLWLTLRCIAFLWVMIAIIIMILFAVGTEGDGYSWGERFLIALQYAAYVAAIFGTLLAIWIWWQNWKVDRGNRKKSARKKNS